MQPTGETRRIRRHRPTPEAVVGRVPVAAKHVHLPPCHCEERRDPFGYPQGRLRNPRVLQDKYGRIATHPSTDSGLWVPAMTEGRCALSHERLLSGLHA